jgi:hypothetical protein
MCVFREVKCEGERCLLCENVDGAVVYMCEGGMVLAICVCSYVMIFFWGEGLIFVLAHLHVGISTSGQYEGSKQTGGSCTNHSSVGRSLSVFYAGGGSHG